MRPIERSNPDNGRSTVEGANELNRSAFVSGKSDCANVQALRFVSHPVVLLRIRFYNDAVGVTTRVCGYQYSSGWYFNQGFGENICVYHYNNHDLTGHQFLLFGNCYYMIESFRIQLDFINVWRSWTERNLEER